MAPTPATPVFAIITAAGASTRMGGARPKPLLDLAGRSVLEWSVAAFAGLVQQIVVTAPAGLEATFSDRVGSPPYQVITGGAARYDSVAAALDCLPAYGIVLVHDAARPLVTRAMIERVIVGTGEHGACIPTIPVVDTIKQLNADGTVRHTLPRSELAAAQTPQGFDLQWLRQAYQAIKPNQAPPTDDASLIERLGHPVATVYGDPLAHKLTSPADVKVLQAMLSIAKDA